MEISSPCEAGACGMCKGHGCECTCHGRPGGAGVREPRRPKAPTPLAGHKMLVSV